MHSPQKVLAAEGGKGVPLDGELSELLQGLLKLDPRHRISAREALANRYFAPRVGAAEERVRIHLRYRSTRAIVFGGFPMTCQRAHLAWALSEVCKKGTWGWKLEHEVVLG